MYGSCLQGCCQQWGGAGALGVSCSNEGGGRSLAHPPAFTDAGNVAGQHRGAVMQGGMSLHHLTLAPPEAVTALVLIP